MKKYFAHLRPLERRLAVGVMVVLILVLNGWLIWPHFSDWGRLKNRLKNARATLASYQAAIAQTSNYQAQVKALEGQGESVALEDQAINFMRTIHDQSVASGVNINSYSRSTMHTNQFSWNKRKISMPLPRTNNSWTSFTNSAPALPWFACVIWSFNPTTRASTSTPTYGSSPVTKNPRRPV